MMFWDLTRKAVLKLSLWRRKSLDSVGPIKKIWKWDIKSLRGRVWAAAANCDAVSCGKVMKWPLMADCPETSLKIAPYGMYMLTASCSALLSLGRFGGMMPGSNPFFRQYGGTLLWLIAEWQPTQIFTFLRVDRERGISWDLRAARDKWAILSPILVKLKFWSKVWIVSSVSPPIDSRFKIWNSLARRTSLVLPVDIHAQTGQIKTSQFFEEREEDFHSSRNLELVSLEMGDSLASMEAVLSSLSAKKSR